MLRGEAGQRQDDGEGARRSAKLRRRGEREGRAARLLRVAVRARRLQLRRHQRVRRRWSCRRRSNIPSAAAARRTRRAARASTVTNPKLLDAVRRRELQPEQRALHAPLPRRAGRSSPTRSWSWCPGFEGGAGDFRILAENLIARAQRRGLVLEVWAFDRRTNQLEDRAGLDIAEEFVEPGDRARLALRRRARRCRSHPLLAAGPNRRAVFYDTQADVPFIGELDEPRLLARHRRGRRRGRARRRATRTSSSAATRPAPASRRATRDRLQPDRRRPGRSGLRQAARPRAARGRRRLDRRRAAHRTTRSTASRRSSTAASSAPCATTPPAASTAPRRARSRPRRPTAPARCRRSARRPTTAYAIVPGLLNPRILAAGELSGDPGRARSRRRREPSSSVDQGAPGNNAVAKVPDLATLARPAAGDGAAAALGSFIDDDGARREHRDLRRDLGRRARVRWSDGLMHLARHHRGASAARRRVLAEQRPAADDAAGRRVGTGEGGHAHRSHGRRTSTRAAPTSPTGTIPSAGPSVTSVERRLHGRRRARSATSARRARTDAARARRRSTSIRRALSVGRGRRDIENLTQAANIDIPVIAFGGTQRAGAGAGRLLGRSASASASCTAPSCDGTPRVVDAVDAEPGVPDVRRRRRRLRGRAWPRASRTSTS